MLTQIWLPQKASGGLRSELPQRVFGCDKHILILIKLFLFAIDNGGRSLCNESLVRKLLFDSFDLGEELSFFARENNVSVSYLKYLFSKYAGVSPKKYYTALRIRRAEELLREGYSVNDIVSLMNFSSPAYFSMFFKRETGKSPTEYTRYNK